MNTKLNIEETKQIIQTSSIPDLYILKHNYEELERYHSSPRYRHLLKLIKQKLTENNNEL